MIMSKVMRMLSADENYKLAETIATTKKNDEIKIREYKNRLTYVNPCSLRLGIVSGQKKVCYNLSQKEYCPV